MSLGLDLDHCPKPFLWHKATSGLHHNALIELVQLVVTSKKNNTSGRTVMLVNWYFQWQSWEVFTKKNWIAAVSHKYALSMDPLLQLLRDKLHYGAYIEIICTGQDESKESRITLLDWAPWQKHDLNHIRSNATLASSHVNPFELKLTNIWEEGMKFIMSFWMISRRSYNGFIPCRLYMHKILQSSFGCRTYNIHLNLKQPSIYS